MVEGRKGVAENQVEGMSRIRAVEAEILHELGAVCVCVCVCCVFVCV
jgi:hypothetical protein